MKKKIDALFANTRKLITDNLDSQIVDEMERQLRDIKNDAKNDADDEKNSDDNANVSDANAKGDVPKAP